MNVDKGFPGFTCPHCGGLVKDVKDSRLRLSDVARFGVPVLRRARKCADCGVRSQTVEILEVNLTRAASADAMHWMSQPEVQAVIGKLVAEGAALPSRGA